jgi:cobalamin synthase
MELTKNVKIFAAIGVINTAVFFPVLEWLLNRSSQHDWVWLAAVVYGVVWFMAGMLLGRSDNARDYRGNLGLVYHSISTLIVLLGAVPVAIFFENFNIMDTIWVMVAMGSSLLIHWLATRNSPKGIDKKEAFK